MTKRGRIKNAKDFAHNLNKYAVQPFVRKIKAEHRKDKKILDVIFG